MLNDYNAVDDLVDRANRLLQDMKANDADRNSLVNLVAEVFQGAAGSANYEFQQEFSRRIENYNIGLERLKATISDVAATGGTVHAADSAAAQLFAQYLR